MMRVTKKFLATLTFLILSFNYLPSCTASNYPYVLPTPDESWNDQFAHVLYLKPSFAGSSWHSYSSETNTSKTGADIIQNAPSKFTWKLASNVSGVLDFVLSSFKYRYTNSEWDTSNTSSPDVKILKNYIYIRVTGPENFDTGWETLDYFFRKHLPDYGVYTIHTFLDEGGLKEVIDVHRKLADAAVCAGRASDLYKEAADAIVNAAAESEIKNKFIVAANAAMEVANLYRQAATTANSYAFELIEVQTACSSAFAAASSISTFSDLADTADVATRAAVFAATAASKAKDIISRKYFVLSDVADDALSVANQMETAASKAKEATNNPSNASKSAVDANECVEMANSKAFEITECLPMPYLVINGVIVNGKSNS